MKKAVIFSLAGPAIMLAFATLSLADESREHAMRGVDLEQEQAEALEARLEQEPGDMNARIQLLGYYFLRQHDDPEAKAPYESHVLWVITHAPDAAIASTPFTSLNSASNPHAFEKASELWRQHVEDHPENTTLLGHAASFFTPERLDQAAEYLEAAKALEPDVARWPKELASIYRLRLLRADVEHRQALAAMALEQLEQAYALLGDDQERRFYLLNDLGQHAFTAGELEKAEGYALELLKQAEQRPDDWNYGNAIHDGHTTLGRLALRNGEPEQAVEHLASAGRTPGSPQLNSFGPNLSLADELLKAGERDAVLDYLDAIERFWPNPRLEPWRQAIRDGRTPALGRFVH